jgi:hypothetical protein
MSGGTSRQAVHKMIDDLTDTKSWAELAKELDRCVAKARATDNGHSGDTIEMADLLKSLDEHDDEQHDD